MLMPNGALTLAYKKGCIFSHFRKVLCFIAQTNSFVIFHNGYPDVEVIAKIYSMIKCNGAMERVLGGLCFLAKIKRLFGGTQPPLASICWVR